MEKILIILKQALINIFLRISLQGCKIPWHYIVTFLLLILNFGLWQNFKVESSIKNSILVQKVDLKNYFSYFKRLESD